MLYLQWIVGIFFRYGVGVVCLPALGLNNVDLEAGQLCVFTTVVIWMLWHRWFVASVVVFCSHFWAMFLLYGGFDLGENVLCFSVSRSESSTGLRI